MRTVCAIVLLSLLLTHSLAFSKPRARDLGIPFDGAPGPLNAITDVKGVEVGHVSLITGESKVGLVAGVARTGVTAIWPVRRKIEGVPAGVYSLSANGEMSGAHYVDEFGLLEGPVLMTNTESLGVVRDAAVGWFTKHFPIVEEAFLPVVGETDDSWLNDMYGFHVKKEHVFQALDSTKTGPVAEGNVGAGVGGHTFHFKGGIGTSSRKVEGGYTVGVLVQSNFGRRSDMTIAGINVGKEIKDLEIIENPAPPTARRTDGSLVGIVATDAPFLPNQLKRIAKRVGLGMARLGSLGRSSSGEYYLAFSTVKPKQGRNKVLSWSALPEEKIDPFFEATIQATEEAIVNGMVAAETMAGVNGNKIFAMPLDRVLPILKRHGRLTK